MLAERWGWDMGREREYQSAVQESALRPYLRLERMPGTWGCPEDSKIAIPRATMQGEKWPKGSAGQGEVLMVIEGIREGSLEAVS